MRSRRVSVCVVMVVVLLVVTAAPASAAQTVSVNTTDQDFLGATLDDMEIEGSGTSASVVGDVGETATANSGSVSTGAIGSGGPEFGLLFNVSQKRNFVIGTLPFQYDNPTDVYLRYHSNGTLIKKKPVPCISSCAPGDVVINATLEPGVTYRLTAAGGGGFEFDEYDKDLATDGVLTTKNYQEPNIAVFERVSVGNATDLSYIGAEHTVSGDSLFANISTTGSTTITAQANSGSGWSNVTSTTINSDSNVSLDISGSSADRYRTVVEASSTGTQYDVSLHDERVTFTSAVPNLFNPDPPHNSDLSSYDGNIEANLSDPDFGLSQSDVVNISVTDSGGNTVAQRDVTGNGTVVFSYTPSLGANNLTWTATDEYGNSDTLEQDFTAPDGLRIYNGSDPDQLVNTATVEATFFGDNTTVTRTTNTGVVSFTGLPNDEMFIVEVSAPGYRDRTVILPSLLQQESVYLLPNTTSAVQVRFVLDDSTGTFDENSKLYIEKPINKSGTTEYEVIVSDTFGVDGVTTYLEKGKRYDLRVVSATGEVSQLGNFDAELNETVTLEPSAAAVTAPDQQAAQYQIEYDEDAGDVSVNYVDPQNATTSLSVEIVARDGTVLRSKQTYTGANSLSASYPIGQLNQTAYVYLNATRSDADNLAVKKPIGPQQQDISPGGLDSVWLQIGGGVMLLLVGGLFSQLNVAAGAVITSLFAGVLWYLGLLSGLASGAAIALAIGIATGNMMLQR